MFRRRTFISGATCLLILLSLVVATGCRWIIKAGYNGTINRATGFCDPGGSECKVDVEASGGSQANIK